MPVGLQFDRITFDPNVMGGKPCIRRMRVTVGTVVGLVARGHTTEEILAALSLSRGTRYSAGPRLRGLAGRRDRRAAR
jgi:uncharacterized protein (DUF433 family)